jgi:endogenous inhibitor of DNA gyrase (YacG/DUF329 family)
MAKRKLVVCPRCGRKVADISGKKFRQLIKKGDWSPEGELAKGHGPDCPWAQTKDWTEEG